MRQLIWVAAIAALVQVPVAYAQNMAPSSAAPSMPSTAAPDSANCGTPDEPKACPPLPRRALKHYRGDRSSNG